MSPWLNTIISIVFLLIGGVTVYLMLRLQGKTEQEKFPQLGKYHRLAGWLFVLVFLFMFFFMLARVENYYEESSARIAIHVTLAVLLFAMLVFKAVIPRFFKKLNKHLFSLGIFSYLVAFVMVFLTAGYYLIWKYEDAPYLHHEDLTQTMVDVELGQNLFIEKCSICHVLTDIMQKRSEKSWENVLNRMIELSAPRISRGEGAQILHYLVRKHTPQPPSAEDNALLEMHCLPCHAPADIEDQDYSRSKWEKIVAEMRDYAPEMIPAEKTDEIVDHILGLSPGQTTK